MARTATIFDPARNICGRTIRVFCNQAMMLVSEHGELVARKPETQRNTRNLNVHDSFGWLQVPPPVLGYQILLLSGDHDVMIDMQAQVQEVLF
jgi:hypothetical protein